MNIDSVENLTSETTSELVIPTYNDVLKAANLTNGFAHKTPVITS
jgi:hypothetical protein